MRVEAALPIWIIKKVEHVIRSQEDEDEDVFENIEPVAGRLVDLSEAGAAVSTDLEVREGDLVEFWAANTGLWIPPLTGGVVQVEEGEMDAPPVLHLHFLNPPLGDLRPVIHELQVLNDPETTTADRDPEGGRVKREENGSAQEVQA